MGKRSSLALSKSGDTYQIEHRGYPERGLRRFHASLGLSLVLAAVCQVGWATVEVAQALVALSGAGALYSGLGYLCYVPFSALGGAISVVPSQERIAFTRSVFGRSSGPPREVPWEGKFEVEVESVGWDKAFFPLGFSRVRIVTDFMTYPVALLGPGQRRTAEDLAGALRQARFGRRHAQPEVDLLKGIERPSGRIPRAP